MQDEPGEQQPPEEQTGFEEFAGEKRASQITGAEPWVSLIGTVISRNTAESSMVVDDGTGQIAVRAPRLPELGSLVRIVGRSFTSAGKAMLDGVIVQDFSCFDVELYRKVLDLEEKVYSQEGDFHP
jgi:hypothetical protein